MSKRARLGLAVFVFLINEGAHAADERLSSSKSERPGVLVMPFIGIPILSFELGAPSNDDDDDDDDENTQSSDVSGVTYEANIVPELGLSLEYGGVGLSISTPIQRSDDDDPETPETRYWDTKAAVGRTYFNIEGGAHRYIGFGRVVDTDDADEDAEQADIVKRGRYLNLAIIPFGDDVELHKRIGEDARRGLRWSPIIELSYDWLDLRSDKPFVPDRYGLMFGRDQSTSEIEIESYGAAAGAVGKFSTDIVQVTLAMTFGRALEAQRLAGAVSSSDSEAVFRRSLGQRFGMRMGAEVTALDWVFGTHFMLDRRDSRLHEAELSSSVGAMIISAGRSLPVGS
jgi:hypothetical protein